MRRDEPITSPSLLLRLRESNDSNSWAAFEAVYAPMVRVYCRRRGIQEADIDDLVQEVMTLVSKAIRNFDYDPSRGKFRAWFGTITANRVKTFLAVHATRIPNLPPSAGNAIPIADPGADSDWDLVFCQEVLRTACKRISSRFEEVTWSCFEKTWLSNLSASQVAAELGLPIHTVYVNKSRVLKQLEEEVRMLADDFPLLAQDPTDTESK
jgi:RNA polymerase sigma factor (sigma-70 family)